MLTYGSREPKINGLRAFWRRVVEVGLGARLAGRHLNADCSNRSDEVHAAPFASRHAGCPARANLTRRFQVRERRERTPPARSSVLPPAIDLDCPAIRHSWRAQVEAARTSAERGSGEVGAPRRFPRRRGRGCRRAAAARGDLDEERADGVGSGGRPMLLRRSPLRRRVRAGRAPARRDVSRFVGSGSGCVRIGLGPRGFRPETGAKRNCCRRNPVHWRYLPSLPARPSARAAKRRVLRGAGHRRPWIPLACRSLLPRRATQRTEPPRPAARAGFSSAGGACRSSATSATPVPRAARGPAAATSRLRWAPAGAGRSRATRRGLGWRPCGRGRAWPRTRR